MRYNSRKDSSNVKRAETDELDSLVRSINLRATEENKDSEPNARRQHQPHLIHGINILETNIENTVSKSKEPHLAHLVEYPKPLRVIAHGIEGAVLGSLLVVAGVIAKDAGVSVYKSVERVRDMPNAVSKEMTRPYQPTGIVATTGSKTNDVFGTIYLDSADGTSYYQADGKNANNYLPNKHEFAIPLSTYIRIISSKGNQTLWVQNTIEVRNSNRQRILYSNNSEIYKEPDTSLLNAVKRGVEDAFTKIPQVENPTNGMKGKGEMDFIGHNILSEYYVCNRYTKEMRFPVGIGLDITAEKEGDNVIMKFGQFPIEKGMLDREKMHVFDKVTYHVKGLEKVYMVFNKQENTGLTITGYGNNETLRSKNLEGVFSLYEMDNKKIMPLLMSRTAAWDISGGAYNVRAEGTGNYVIVTTALSKNK